eukprot:scaffold2611_cov114-Isochrysis_galbana.AAC.3
MASGDKRERPFVVGAGVSKRSNYGQGSATARVTPHRLIDDEFAFLLIEDTLAASRAKTKGWIQSRVLAPNEYAEVCRDCPSMPMQRCTSQSTQACASSSNALAYTRSTVPMGVLPSAPLTTYTPGSDRGTTGRAGPRPGGPAGALRRDDRRGTPCSGHT